jgi:hypothetical protein
MAQGLALGQDKVLDPAPIADGTRQDRELYTFAQSDVHETGTFAQR